MKLNIISPEGVLYEGEVKSAIFPSISGSFEVLPHHAPLIAAMKEGKIHYETDTETKEMEVRDGFVEVKDDVITVCIEQKKA
jgi:F-type H+-transporting ATPase subunit epsilon